MNQKDSVLTEPIKELVAIGAAVGAHCAPCLEHHVQAAVEAGVPEEHIRAAVEIGHAVEKGAMSAMKEISASTLEELLSAGLRPGESPGEAGEETVLKIYDPAMCCSSGVCGPSVDPVLAQFAGTLKMVTAQPGVRVERYNLGQEPQAFVANTEVKSMLGNGGEKRLPFIFINDQLWLQGRYPAKDELFEALKIKNTPVLSPFPATTENGSCCGDEGCC